jgi:4-hydroxybenzoyl-CoA thioesterase
MAHVECDFLAPSRIGDILRFALRVARIGRSSMTLRIECRSGDELRVRAHLTVVFASLETLRSVPISTDLRQRIERFLD